MLLRLCGILQLPNENAVNDQNRDIDEADAKRYNVSTEDFQFPRFCGK